MARRIDVGLAALFIVSTLLEVALRDELAARPFSALLGVTFALALVFRRKHPLWAVLAAFGLASVSTAIEIGLGLAEAAGPYSGACILLLPYSLARWGARRDILIGSGVMFVTYLVSLAHREMHGVSELIGSAVVMLFPGAVGLTVRFRAEAQSRALAHAKLKEREQLARELHDSVAHHVAAITLQAQAARAVLATCPDAASRALAAIEDEARKTLADLRGIVGALRDDASRAPQGHLEDIKTFARETGPAVVVEFSGDLVGLPAAVERALYRLAQESVTNAIKHARNATRIEICVVAAADEVHLSAQDDGEASGARRNAGFGLVGMAERVALLGGTFSAGPADGGWRVAASLPRTGEAA